MNEPEVGTAAWFELLTFEERLGHVQVWAKYADKAEGETDEGTLFHLRWLVAQVPNLRAGVLREAADAIDAETRQLKADEVLEPEKFRPCRDASAQLRRMADEAAVR